MHIETGTQYIQLTNYVPNMPTSTQFGRFDVHNFTDNNITEFKYCCGIDHASCRYEQN